MDYLDSLKIFFLIYCVYFSANRIWNAENRNIGLLKLVVITVLSFLLGGLWIFLLYKII